MLQPSAHDVDAAVMTRAQHLTLARSSAERLRAHLCGFIHDCHAEGADAREWEVREIEQQFDLLMQRLRRLPDAS